MSLNLHDALLLSVDIDYPASSVTFQFRKPGELIAVSISRYTSLELFNVSPWGQSHNVNQAAVYFDEETRLKHVKIQLQSGDEILATGIDIEVSTS